MRFIDHFRDVATHVLISLVIIVAHILIGAGGVWVLMSAVAATSFSPQEAEQLDLIWWIQGATFGAAGALWVLLVSYVITYIKRFTGAKTDT